MGLDLCFKRADVLAAGATFTVEQYGTQEEIANAHNSGDEYLVKYLKGHTELVQFPCLQWRLDNGSSNEVCVRANKWGPSYGPLTKWLKANHIEWTEG